MKRILQYFHNVTKSSKIVWLFISCVVLFVYLITPPAGLEYDLGGYLTIRNHRQVLQFR